MPEDLDYDMNILDNRRMLKANGTEIQGVPFTFESTKTRTNVRDPETGKLVEVESTAWHVEPHASNEIQL